MKKYLALVGDKKGYIHFALLYAFRLPKGKKI